MGTEGGSTDDVSAPAGEGGAGPPGADGDGGGGVSDEHVAQDYFDDEMSSIRRELDELKQSVQHLIASNTARASSTTNGHSPTQSPAAPPARPQAGEGHGASGLPGGESEPERSPKPSHWYWRSVRGG